MQTALQAAVLVGVGVLLTLLGQALVRRRLPHTTLAAHTAVAGDVHATLAVVYAVILTQVAVAAWNGGEEARAVAEAEAGSALDLFRLAEGFPQPARGEVEAAPIADARVAVVEEWPAMGRRETPVAAATSRVVALYRVFDRLEVGALGASVRYAASLDGADELDDARGLRPPAGAVCPG